MCSFIFSDNRCIVYAVITSFSDLLCSSFSVTTAQKLTILGPDIYEEHIAPLNLIMFIFLMVIDIEKLDMYRLYSRLDGWPDHV